MADPGKEAGSTAEEEERARLTAEVEALRGMEGAEALREAKEARLKVLRTAKLAAKPAHIQVSDLDTQIAKKLKAVARFKEEIQSFAQKQADAQVELTAVSKQLAELQVQKEQLMATVAPAPADAGQAAAAAIVHIDSLSKLMSGPTGRRGRQGCRLCGSSRRRRLRTMRRRPRRRGQAEGARQWTRAGTRNRRQARRT